MGLFNDFFKKSNYEEEIYKSDDDTNHWADSITTGWEYKCYLYLSTPKICLEKDGFIISNSSVKPELIGEPNNLGIDGDPSGEFGFWIRRHGYEEEFESLAEISENMVYARPTVIGKIPPKSTLENDLRNFLIDFRSIIESSQAIRSKLYLIKEVISNKSKENNFIYKKLLEKHKFPECYFQKELCNISGVNARLSKLLWDSGFVCQEEVLKASEETLLKIKGIDKNFINTLKLIKNNL